MQDNAGNYYNYKTNIGNSAADGIELYAAWMPVTGTNIDIKGNKPEVAPNQITRNGVHAGYKALSASIQYNYVSKPYSDVLNTETLAPNGPKGLLPGYALWDLNITMRFPNNYQLKGGINNLVNKQYFTKKTHFLSRSRHLAIRWPLPLHNRGMRVLSGLALSGAEELKG